jgi:hypothetical protein
VAVHSTVRGASFGDKETPCRGEIRYHFFHS